MSSNSIPLVQFLSACLDNFTDKRVAAILVLFLTGDAGTAAGQGLSPASPTQEFIYFGGRLVAVEERGPGGSGNAAVKGGITASSGVNASPSTAPAATSSGATPPPQPSPSTPPQDASAGAGKTIATPPSTHGASLTQP